MSKLSPEFPKRPKVKEAKNVELGDVRHTNTIKERLTEPAKHRALSQKFLELSLGIKDRANDPNRATIGKKIDLANSTQLVIDGLKNAGLLDSAIEQAIASLP